LQEIRASVERTRHLEELAARRQAEKHFYWPPGFVKNSGPLTPEEMTAVLKNIEENKELSDRLERLVEATKQKD
jgi:hypothetical protein